MRILVATHAAREGLNLQAHCWNLFHFDVPWNPSRMEQRNGRIDRKLQPPHPQPARPQPPPDMRLQTSFAQVTVLIQQRHQHQFRRIVGQTMNVHLNHLALRKPFHADRANVFLQTTNNHFIAVCRFDGNASAETLWVEQFQQSGKAVAVPVVGRGGEEQSMFKSFGEVFDGSRDLRINRVFRTAGRGRVVGFVQNQHGCGAKRAEPVAQWSTVMFIDEQPMGD
ncbi:MAG: helicase-related protein [Planctomyces sp.]